ncbi:MAG: choice-of-anchor D domain-containing protein [Terriglobia bacterium]
MNQISQASFDSGARPLQGDNKIPGSKTENAGNDSHTLEPLIGLNPQSINFGDVQVGDKSITPVTITNVGNNIVKILQAPVTGNGFSISDLVLPLTLSPGNHKTFNAIFAPNQNGNSQGDIMIITDFQGVPFYVSLSGTGTQGNTLLLSLNPTSTNFGNVVVNARSTLPVEMINTGTGRVTVTQSVLTGKDYSVGGLDLPLTIPAGKNSSFNVTFAPVTTGVFNGNISIISNATNSPANESLTGTGVTAPYVSLTWDASTSQNVIGYNVYRGVQINGPFSKINTSLVPGTWYQDDNVYSGDTYYYVTTAVNSQNVESAYSNEAEATLPPS